MNFADWFQLLGTIHGSNIGSIGRGFWLISLLLLWNFFKPFTLTIGLINTYKIPPHLLSNVTRMLSNWDINFWIGTNSPYLLCPLYTCRMWNLMMALVGNKYVLNIPGHQLPTPPRNKKNWIALVQHIYGNFHHFP